jgi:hypothetical protein
MYHIRTTRNRMTLTFSDGRVKMGFFGIERGLTGRGGPPSASMSLNVITPTLGLALGLAAALLIVDGLGWRVVAAMFDRELLVTGKRT